MPARDIGEGGGDVQVTGDFVSVAKEERQHIRYWTRKYVSKADMHFLLAREGIAKPVSACFSLPDQMVSKVRGIGIEPKGNREIISSLRFAAGRGDIIADAIEAISGTNFRGGKICTTGIGAVVVCGSTVQIIGAQVPNSLVVCFPGACSVPLVRSRCISVVEVQRCIDVVTECRDFNPCQQSPRGGIIAFDLVIQLCRSV